MAYVSIEWAKQSAGALRYALKERSERDVTDTEGCSPSTAINDFKAVRLEHNNEGGNQALLVLQSFSPSDSAKHTPEVFNSIGRKLAEANFPGHQFVIKTHTDTEHHIHNHIVLNTVNSETGRKIENKRALIEQLRGSSDKICKEHGLSVINEVARERAARLPRKVQQMIRAGKKSYLFDLVQKADLARSMASSFSEYRDILAEFKIRTVIEKKNISYFYPGKERGKRGSKLGRDYDKPGLAEAFKANQQMYLDHSELRSKNLQQITRVRDHGLPDLPGLVSKFSQPYHTSLPAPRNLDVYALASRRNRELVYRSDHELAHSFAPISEIRKARGGNILEYCERNKIALTVNERGQKVIKGREFVELSEHEFRNTKNGTRGSLIDLVAAHKKVSLMQAVAHINDNPRLLLLEQHFGEVPRKYTSFYVPHPERMEWSKSAEALGRFLSSFGAHRGHAKALLDQNLAHVHKSGLIRFFSKGHDDSAIEFTETDHGKWRKSSHGKPQSPFFSEAGTGNKVAVFSDPIALMRGAGRSLFDKKQRELGILGLLTPDPRLVHQFMAANKHITEILFVGSSREKLTQVELDFFENLKGQYRKHGVEMKHVSDPKSLHKQMERGRHDSGLSL